MDGDFGNLPELIEVAESHGASVFVDEAHSILACGENGRCRREVRGGRQDSFDLWDVLEGFRRAWRICGRLERHGRLSALLRAPLCLFLCVASRSGRRNSKVPELGQKEPQLRTQLWKNAAYFHEQLGALGLDTGSSSTYVMPIVIGDRERLYHFGHKLRQRGLWVAPVDYPARAAESRLFPGLCDREPYPGGFG